ncbi:MAG: hypothetical protein JW871_01260 [Endomicrobiales bacterium]|nr:hypothetical protein [Endomicrobiales bacterium]
MPKIKFVKKPWGAERWFAKTRKYAGKLLIIKKGHRLSLQYHKIKEETLFLFKGKLKLTIGPKNGKLKTKIVRSEYVFHCPPKTVHRLEALENCLIIEVSTSELHDVVRIQDDYKR